MGYDLSRSMVREAVTLTVDEVADAAYLLLSAEDAVETLAFPVTPDWMVVDLDAEGKLVGIEILGAKERLR